MDPAPWTRKRDCTIPELMAALSKSRGGHEALVYPDHHLRWTFADLDRHCEEISLALYALGIRPGDRVTVWSENRPEWIPLQLSLARLGAILVTANTALKFPEIEYVLQQSGSCMLFYSAGSASNDYAESLTKIRGNLSQLRHEVFLGTTAPSPSLPYSEFLQLAAQADRQQLNAITDQLHPDDVINMQYTSGTTGFPKGVMLSHRNLVNNAYCIGSQLNFQPGERLALTVPLFHCFGCVVGTLGAYCSAVTICAQDQFEPGAALDLIEQESCNIIYGVPTHYRLLVEAQQQQARDLSSMRTAIMAGAPCPESLIRQIVEDLSCPQATAAYGLTECSPGVSISEPQDSLQRRATTAGRPLDEIEVRVVDPNSGQILGPGEPGELQVRGHCVMKGYHNNPEATAEVLSPDGWLKTGDLATLAEDRTLRIVGRIKEMIIRGGENLYPAEIEEALRQHSAIREIAVYGVPHEVLGEQLHAAVCLHPETTFDHEEFRQWAKERLAGAKVPAVVRVVEEFPMTASGKIQKFILTQQAQSS